MSTVSPEGFVVRQSPYGFAETLDRLEANIEAKGMAIVARIDHASAASSVKLSLRPTTVLLFGNPRVGTVLMQATPTIAIHLPLKILLWQDDDGTVWIAHDDPHWFGCRHHTGETSAAVLDKMQSGINKIVQDGLP